MIEHQEAEILVWEVNPNPTMKISLGAHVYYQTIKRRKGSVMRLISEIKVTVEDCRSDTIGGLIVGLEIWCKAVVPFLYGNSDCWVEMPKSISHCFFRTLFCAAKRTPITMFYWDSGFLLEDNFIMLKKLPFLHHLSTLPSNS